MLAAGVLEIIITFKRDSDSQICLNGDVFLKLMEVELKWMGL